MENKLRKLLNTIYVTNELAYLSLDGENVVISEQGKELGRLPFTNIESIICMNYIGCSPALMGKCAENMIGLSFVSTSGRFLARITGEFKGNVFLRKAQLEVLENEKIQLELVRKLLACKFKNTKNLIKRSLRDNKNLNQEEKIQKCLETIEINIKKIQEETNFDTLRGIEGQTAKSFFNIFDILFTQQREDFLLYGRSKRPPLDATNAVLSFLYTVCINDIASALECVGLDPYIGFFHTLRPGRLSLACDLVEEYRALVERMVISIINLKVINISDFENQVSGAVLLNEGRKKVISAWQNKKKEIIMHPYLKEKIPIGLFPYVQANLLAKYIRGENKEYYNLEWK